MEDARVEEIRQRKVEKGRDETWNRRKKLEIKKEYERWR